VATVSAPTHGYDYLDGTALLLLACALTPAQARANETQFKKALVTAGRLGRERAPRPHATPVQRGRSPDGRDGAENLG
jgi:hypothetical protein